MTYDVPTGDDVKASAKSGAMTGGGVAIGEVVGRSVLGPGLGTAAGGIAAAASMDGKSRDTAAALAVERAANELMAGAGSSGGDNSRGSI